MLAWGAVLLVLGAAALLKVGSAVTAGSRPPASLHLTNLQLTPNPYRLITQITVAGKPAGRRRPGQTHRPPKRCCGCPGRPPSDACTQQAGGSGGDAGG